MQEIGALLRKRREEKGLTLQDLQAQTKIRLRYLQAIEEGDLGKIPLGEVYVKGFIRAYAQALGLDPQEILQEYQKSATPAPPFPPSPEAPAAPAAPLPWRRYLLFAGVALVFLFLVLAVGISLGPGKRLAEPPSPLPPSSGGPSLSPGGEKAPPPAAPKLPEIRTDENTPTRAVYSVGAAELALTLSFSDLCWVSVNVDGKTVLEENVPAGKTLSWVAKESIKLRAGKPWTIKINLNGVDLGPGGEYGPVRDLVFLRKP